MDKREAASMTRRVRLVGDGVENPANARTQMDAAAMFGAACAFRDTRGLLAAWDAERGRELDLIDTNSLIDQQWPIVAVENTLGASIVFGATLPGTQASIVVAGARIDGPPIHRVNLAGRDTLLVIPDEGEAGMPSFNSLGGSVERARIDLSVPTLHYRYRLVATIVMAEAARQTGLRPAGQPRLPGRRGLTYESTLSTVATGGAEEVDPAVLKAY